MKNSDEMNVDQVAEMNRAMAGMALEMAEWKHASGGAISEVAAGWVTPHYLVAVRGRLAAVPDGSERFELLRLTVADTVALQRGSHYADRLQLERDRLEFDQQKHRDALAAVAKQQEVPQRRDPKLPLSDEDRKAIIDKADEILGLK